MQSNRKLELSAIHQEADVQVNFYRRVHFNFPTYVLGFSKVTIKKWNFKQCHSLKPRCYLIFQHYIYNFFPKYKDLKFKQHKIYQLNSKE